MPIATGSISPPSSRLLHSPSLPSHGAPADARLGQKGAHLPLSSSYSRHGRDQNSDSGLERLVSLLGGFCTSLLPDNPVVFYGLSPPGVCSPKLSSTLLPKTRGVPLLPRIPAHRQHRRPWLRARPPPRRPGPRARCRWLYPQYLVCEQGSRLWPYPHHQWHAARD